MIATSRVHPRGVLVVAGACFLALTLTIAVLGSAPADVSLREALLALASPAVVDTMRVVNSAGDWRVLLPGTLLLFVVFRRARETWWLWVALMIVAPTLESVFKELVGRTRPESLALSFPSGHSTAAAAFFGALMFLAPALPPWLCAAVRVLATLMILLVGMARVVLRAHWPSDVLAGIALGVALAAAAGLLALRRPAHAAPPVRARG